MTSKFRINKEVVANTFISYCGKEVKLSISKRFYDKRELKKLLKYLNNTAIKQLKKLPKKYWRSEY